MSTSDMKVADDMVVSLDYTLHLDDGVEIDSSDEGEPLEFLQGYGQIIPGLEQALYGMKVGDEKKVTVEAADAYGEFDEDNFESMPRSAFPDDLELEEGMELHLRDHETNELFTAFVAEVNKKEVLLDFNHPLAGERLHFQVRVAGLRKATAEELDHGHVHGPHAH